MLGSSFLLSLLKEMSGSKAAKYYSLITPVDANVVCPQMLFVEKQLPAVAAHEELSDEN